MGSEQPPASRHWLAERTFLRGDGAELRRFVRAFGSRAWLAGTALSDLVLAVNEAWACATAQGPGTARVRLWLDGARLYCEVRGDLYRDARGDALMRRRAASGPRPAASRGEADALRRRVLRQVCDYFHVEPGRDATRVLLTMAVRRAAQDPSGRAGMPRPR